MHEAPAALCVDSVARCRRRLRHLTGREGENGALPVETYKSVNGDLYLLGMRPGPSGSGNPETVVCWFSVVCPVLAVVSLPLDALIDTLLLPADLRAAREPENAL